mmetsp:Transcript_14397/g.57290  ORF Transcript_14397/g.57290 Transcript_14397/m.57290 type:complete len:113 (-) Transcript_14397:63-401(-)
MVMQVPCIAMNGVTSSTSCRNAFAAASMPHLKKRRSNAHIHINVPPRTCVDPADVISILGCHLDLDVWELLDPSVWGGIIKRGVNTSEYRAHNTSTLDHNLKRIIDIVSIAE